MECLLCSKQVVFKHFIYSNIEPQNNFVRQILLLDFFYRREMEACQRPTIISRVPFRDTAGWPSLNYAGGSRN
jgi:hypothetical protein